jgi:superfamily I DNA and RNA helicase
MTRAIGLGFRREMIATITFRGREHSIFTPYDRLGAHRLKAFTGHYDLLGNPVYTEGDFLIDSVYRFKGQSAPCVIFTEIDFDALDTPTVRKLFVGATRASLKLILVVSERAAQKLMERKERP